MSDYAQWFDTLGQCRGCSRTATGVLRGTSNQNLGPYCKPCAERAIKRAHKKGQFWPDAELDVRGKA